MNQATVLSLPKRLDIDDQVLTQLNNRCLFAIKFSRSVEFTASRIYLHNSIATRLNARPVYTRQSLNQTMQYKHLLRRPAMQPHLLCKHLHKLLCCTSNATPAMRSTCCLCKPPQQLPANGPLLSDTPTKRIEPRREIYRNLGRISA